MRLLILGGTLFVGRHLADAALARGWEVTLFNRGRTAPGSVAGVREIMGDRSTAEGLAGLAKGEWDAVVDTCAYVPRVARMSAELLRGRVGHYTLVSSASVYAGATGGDETAALEVLPTGEEQSEDVPRFYGALKAACERAVEEAFGGPVMSARAGLIVGPRDPSWRWSYWVDRVARGGDLAAPGAPGDPVQWIDGRDLAAFVLDAAGAGMAGPCNIVGPVGGGGTMGALLGEIVSAVNPAARLVWVGHERLAAAGLAPMTGMPLWIPAEAAGFYGWSGARAATAGLRSRPAGETARDVKAWLDAGGGAAVKRSAAITAEAEAALLAGR